MKKLFTCSILCLGFLFADDVSTIDKAYDNISIKTESFLSGADSYFAAFLDYISTLNQDKNSQESPDSIKIDKLFQNEKYIDQTQDSFLLFSNDYIYNSLEDNEVNLVLRGKIALNKSNQRLKIFFNSFSREDIINQTDNKSEIGLSYLNGIKKDLNIHYSLGIRSLNPYTSARISYKHKTNNWAIVPEQYLEYSIKDEFKERSTIYFDRNLYKDTLFRAQVQRSTRSKESGMSYNGSLSLYWTPIKDTGLYFSQSFSGNTHYKTEENKYFRGINNYQTKFTVRQSILRKWFFYEVSPAINFSEKNNFEANYSLYLRFDVFFRTDK